MVNFYCEGLLIMIIKFKDTSGFSNIENLNFLEKIRKEKSNWNGSTVYNLHFLRNPVTKFEDRKHYAEVRVSEAVMNEIIEKSGFVCESK